MIDDYLAVLGLPRARPSVEYLFALHRAQVSRVPYTNVQIMRGTPAGIDPRAAVRQILDGQGGYCFHLNGALSWLLRELGFAVTLHRGYVSRHGETERPSLNHLVLLVHDLEGGVWFVDTGLGDAIYEPLPLRDGNYRQGPFAYALSYESGWWRFTHDETGSFAAMEFEPAAATIDDFAEAHHFLSTSPASSFRRFLLAQVRLADRVDSLRACTRLVVGADGRHEQTLSDPAQWAAAYHSLGVSKVDDLFAETWRAHEVWLASL